jgi:hypothetical protein
VKPFSFRAIKERAFERAVLLFARTKLQRYADLRQLEVDTREKVFRAEFLLQGESEPVVVSRARYRVEIRGKRKMLILFDIHISRDWAQNLLDDRFPEIPIAIPEFVSFLD